MLFETLGDLEGFGLLLRPVVILGFSFRVFYTSYFVMPDQFCVLLFAHGKVVIIQTSFISDLLRDELSMMSSWDTLINYLLLFWIHHKICECKLGHFDIIGEDVKRKIISFGNSDEF